MLLLNASYLLTHVHGENESLWDAFLEVAFDPAHILAELFFTVVFDGVFIALIWGVLFKRILLPRLRKEIHADIDKEHGIEPH